MKKLSLSTLFQKIGYFYRFIFKKSKSMRYFKAQTIHYGKQVDMYVGFEYDLSSNQTILTQKIIGKTVVSGDIHEDEGDITNVWINRYSTGNGFSECTQQEFDQYQIGQKI